MGQHHRRRGKSVKAVEFKPRKAMLVNLSIRQLIENDPDDARSRGFALNCR